MPPIAIAKEILLRLVERSRSRLAGGQAILGLLALVIFYSTLWRPPADGPNNDFAQVYMAGLTWRLGIPPYRKVDPAFRVPDGPSSDILYVYFYPPLLNALAAPFSFFSYWTACRLWLILTFSTLLFGVWQYTRLLFPEWSFSLRLMVLGITALSCSVRWNVNQLQPTAPIVAMLFLFVCAVVRNRWPLTCLLALLISLKPTFFLPVCGLLWFRRRYGTLALILAVVVLLNLLASFQTGVATTLSDYAKKTVHATQTGALTRLGTRDLLTYYRFSQTPAAGIQTEQANPGTNRWRDQNLTLNYILSTWFPPRMTVSLLVATFVLISLGMLAMLRRRAEHAPWRDDPQFLALVFCVLTCLSLLFGYHPRYDALGLIPSVFMALALIRRYPTDRVAWTVLVVGLLFAFLLPMTAYGLWYRYVTTPYDLAVLVPIGAYCTLAMFIGLFVLLWRYAPTTACASQISGQSIPQE